MHEAWFIEHVNNLVATGELQPDTVQGDEFIHGAAHAYMEQFWRGFYANEAQAHA